MLKERDSLAPGVMVRVGSTALRQVAGTERVVEGVTERLVALASEPVLAELRETENRIASFGPDAYEQGKG
ncbi:hypothetical protein [Streptomyces cinereoruber]|uniref:hypothetical protein n=1 Tax=Streptomyces cinereoruber TaxID=67260 RepID=UPI00363313BC